MRASFVPMAVTPELEAALRRYRTAAERIGKVGYLAGSVNEQRFQQAYEEFAAVNNRTEGQPYMMLPKKRYRQA